MFTIEHVWLIASVHCQTKSSQTFIETFHGRKSMCKTFTDDFTTRKPFQRIADIKCQLHIEIMYHIIQCYKIVLSILMQVKQIFTFIPKTNIVMKTLENSLVEIFGWFSDSRLATLLKSSPWKKRFPKILQIVRDRCLFLMKLFIFPYLDWIRTRKNSGFGLFSHSELLSIWSRQWF